MRSSAIVCSVSGCFEEGAEELFHRALAAIDRPINIEGRAVALMQAGRWPEAWRLLVALADRPGITDTTWNGLAHTLCFLPPSERSGDAAALLAQVVERGAKSPYVLHNAACAWIALGDRGRALDAVEGAVRAARAQIIAGEGYVQAELDSIEADEDLAGLRTDTRFAACFRPSG